MNPTRARLTDPNQALPAAVREFLATLEHEPKR